MSASNSEKLKTNCDAVTQRIINSSSTLNSLTSSSSASLTLSNSNVIKAVNNGAKLNNQQNQHPYRHHQQKQQQHQQQLRQQHNQQIQPKQKQEIAAVTKQDYSDNFQIESQKLSSDVQKVLKQEQELQKQLYSGSNVAPGWLRVNHNSKVIYISPSGIGLASLKQVKNYLLTRGTCKCGLPFPLRVELFFNFNTEVPTVPLKTPIDSIKFDPTCQHRKRLTTNQQTAPIQTDIKRIKLDNSNNIKQRTSGECLLPSYVTSATSKIINKTTATPKSTTSTVMIVNNNNNNNNSSNNNNATLVTTSNNIQSQVSQSKQPQVAFHQQQQRSAQIQQQPQFMQHDMSMMGGSNVVMRVLKDDGTEADGVKLPPWKKNSIVQQTQIVKNVHQHQQHQQQTSQMVPQSVPIFQINGQNVIAIDQNNQQYHVQQPQQIQIIEQKSDGSETWMTTSDGKLSKTILRRRPTFKEDPTGYLNQQTALLQNTITTLHSPNENHANVKTQEGNEKRQFIQQIVKSAPSTAQITTTIGGQTLTHMPNGVVQIQQNCDIKQGVATAAARPILIQDSKDQVQVTPNKVVRQNPKGRPPKNPQTIAKRLVQMSQESPVSSTSGAKIVKSHTPDISSSSQFPESAAETQIVQSENSEIVKMMTKEMVRTSMTQVKTISNPSTYTTSGMINMRKPPMTMMKKPPTTMINPMKSPGTMTGQQIMMTSNGQQFIVLPQQQQQQQPQNIMLNNNGIVQIQNTNTTNQRIIQTTTGQNGNFLIQSGGGNMLTTSNPTGNFVLSNGQQLNPVFIQNGQIIQSPTNMLSPKGNILLSNAAGGKTIITGNNQLGQQTVLLNGIPGHQVMMPSPTTTLMQDSASMIQNNQQQNITVTTEKKKGRKRKIPLSDNQQPVQVSSTTIQAPQQQQQQQHHQNIIQGFQIAQPNIIKIPQQQQPQIILQNGQALIQQPINLLGGQQLMLQPHGGFPQLMISPDGGNSIVQLQNPTFNSIIQTPQGMMIRAPIQQQQQQMQKTIITNNGQQFIVNQAGMNQMFNSPMGFILQNQQNQQQQIINSAQQPIMMQAQAQGQHIITQPQVITQTPTSMSQGTIIGQQTQFITQSDGKVSSQRKIIHHQKVQQQKFFPQMMKPQRMAPVQTIVPEIEQQEEEDEELQEDEEQQENCEEVEQEEQEISFEDDKPDMIQELHHGQQQILHHSMMGDGQCGIMNIDDITIEMDEINDLNEYLNAIDEEDNRMTQMGLSSLQQQFANSPPDTTTHSPRSPIQMSSDKSNGSSDSTNMVQFVSSSEPDCISNVVSPEGVDHSNSPSHHQLQYSNTSQGTFKLPMEPKSSMTSPRSTTPMSPMPQTINFDRNQRPDSHESASSYHRTDTPPHDDDGDGSPRKSDFDLLKESPPVNTIKPIALSLIESDDSNSNPLPSTSRVKSSFTIGDLIWGAARGSDAWPGKVVTSPDGEPTSSDCVWVKWFGGRQNTEIVLCSSLKTLSEGLEAHHAAQKDSRKGRKLNSHLERAIQKAMSELDKQSKKKTNERKSVTKSPKSKSIKLTPATDKK